MTSFSERLLAASEATQSLVCVGLDVNPALMPASVLRQAQDERITGRTQDERAVVEFNRAIVDATGDLVCAYKPNIAFYEALGIPGLRALDATVSHIRDAAPDAVIIIDAKRGDIGNTVEAYATAMFEVWGFDAVTVNPWGGMDTIEPWLERGNGGIIVWCRGSNPGAGDLQDLAVDGGEQVYMRLARSLANLSAGGNLGLVVGATAPEQLAAVRRVCPDAPILIPGVGAQGGDLEASVQNGVDRHGRMAIINSGRGIIYASSGTDYAEAARVAASGLRDGINDTLNSMGLGWRPTEK
ncbi:MAG: orotidine-5'-phosphate decarboxylase [Chloroflexi bacterium]|nr:orotidine-5'-phosphate decarboxylase [Chloroflexota bacterium]